jgi:hypothetical protein
MTDYPTGVCPSCSRPVIWAATRNGKVMPVDPEPAAGGNVRLVERGGMQPLAEVIGNPARQFGLTLRMPHHSTCPRPVRRQR